MKVGWIQLSPPRMRRRTPQGWRPWWGISGRSTLCSLAAAMASGVGVHLVKVHAGVLLHRLDHGHALPMGQVDLLALIGDLQGAADLHGNGLHHILYQIHHAVVISIRLIQLDAGEFRIVGGIHTLVAEDPSHLVHPIHTAHDQALQIKLRLDTQNHVQIQRVVMGIEGTGGCADLKGGEDGGIHLQEAPTVQEGGATPAGSDCASRRCPSHRDS